MSEVNDQQAYSC